MEEKHKRQSISLKRKIEILDAVGRDPKKKKTLIAEEFEIPLATLCNIVKQRDKYRNQFLSSKNDPRLQKKTRGAKHDDIDSQLLQWFAQAG